MRTPPEPRALHLIAAGDVEPASDGWRRASSWALRQSGFCEVEAYVSEALRLFETEPKRPEHDERELELRMLYNRALLVSRGYPTPRTAP